MGSMQIVFLFDLNACRDLIFKPKGELNKKLLSVRLACLRLLTDFSSKSPSLKWGFKFFDSESPKTQNMCKFNCSYVSLENFETLENEICVRYERHLSFLQALSDSAEKSETSVNKKSEEEMSIDAPVKILQFALTQILCEFQWEPTESPSVKKIKALNTRKRNYLFVFNDFKDNDEFLLKYFGLNTCPSKSKLINTFLPQSLRDPLLKKSDINLILLNTCLDQKFMGSFTSKMLPLLSQIMQAIHGSIVPLLILSQPLYSMKLLDTTQETMCEGKVSLNPDLYSTYCNSIIPFSYLFEQSLNQPFYSTVSTYIYKSCIEFTSKSVQLSVQVMEIFKKKSNLNKGPSSLKNKCVGSKKITWSKFIVHFAVPRNSHHTAYEVLLCLPNHSKSSATEAETLMSLNKKLSLEGISLVLECITECGIKMPGILSPLSSDAAVISVLAPSVNQLLHEACENSTTNSMQIDCQNNSNEIQNFKTEVTAFSRHAKIENSEGTTLKPFLMECLEPWFQPTSDVSKITAHIESMPSRNSLKMESYWQLLKQSVKNGKRISEKLSKLNLTNGVESNSGEKGMENTADSDNSQIIEPELPDFNYEELLSAIKDTYNSAIELTSNIVTSAKRILNMLVKYCTKHSCASSVEDDVYSIFKDNLFMTAIKVIEKYEMLDSQEAVQQKIKECQIQVLLILGIENMKNCPDRLNCVSTVTSLLRLMIFYSGIEELQNFLHDIIKKNYSKNLHDVLVEIGDELDISIFEDEESLSPADTLSSELYNDDEVLSSVLSEKSASSTCSLKGNKDNSKVESRKLIRHRSDISDSSRCRQVLLPKSAKKKKKKTPVKKATRYSPRIAAKRNELVHEKSSKVCRNLFAGEKLNRTPKKITDPCTPKSKKKRYEKFVAETPSHEQNLSAVQRRNSLIELSKLTKIDESPKILKTAKDDASKEFRERLEKAHQESQKLKLHCHGVKDSTPDGKRRLSLKLFSSPSSRPNIFMSPTARMGIKKCTKRLFHDISPAKTTENNKRHKLIDKSELTPKKNET